MTIYVRNIDKLDTYSRAYVSIDDVPEPERTTCMLLDAAANNQGTATLKRLGTRVCKHDDIHYGLSTTFNYVYAITAKHKGKLVLDFRVTSSAEIIS